MPLPNGYHVGAWPAGSQGVEAGPVAMRTGWAARLVLVPAGEALNHHQQVANGEEYERDRRITGEPPLGGVAQAEVMEQTREEDETDDQRGELKPNTQSTQQAAPPLFAREA